MSTLKATLPFLDKLGQTIRPGSIIIYGHALGRCAALRIGKVIRVGLKKPDIGFLYGQPQERITVQGIDDERSSEEPKLTKTKGTLMFPDRIVVMNPSLLPEKIKKLLERVKPEGCLCGCGANDNDHCEITAARDRLRAASDIPINSDYPVVNS